MDYKIEYNDFFEFLELKNIIASKRRIKRNSKAKLYNYFEQFYMLVFAFVLFYVSYIFSFNIVFEDVFLIFSILSLTMILSFLVLFLIYVIQYNEYRSGRNGKMTFTSKGIVDYADKGYICGFSWDKIELVIVGKNSTVVFSKYPFCLFVNSKNSREVIDNVKRNTSTCKIVYRKK